MVRFWGILVKFWGAYLAGWNEAEPLCRGRGAEAQFREVVDGHLLRGLVFQAHRLLYHSALGLRVTKKKK